MRQFTNERGDVRWQPQVDSHSYCWGYAGKRWANDDTQFGTGSPVLFRRQKKAARVERKRVKDLETRRWQAVAKEDVEKAER